jgi:hypothetical protein
MAKKRTRARKRSKGPNPLGSGSEAATEAATPSATEAPSTTASEPDPVDSSAALAALATRPPTAPPPVAAAEPAVEPARRRRETTGVADLARRALPRGGFVRGAMLGIAIAIPAVAAAAFALSQLDLGGDPAAPFARVLAFAAVFAGLPAALSAGGVGRLAARAAARPDRRVRAAIRAAAPPLAAAGAGLVVLTVVPLGALPPDASAWFATGGVGIVVGATCGAILGLWIGTSPERG